MSWKNSHVLVTGAGGFIGSHLVEALLAQGAQVRAFLRYNSATSKRNLDLLPSELQRRIEAYFGDLRDGKAVRGACEGMECVFHLGAIISIPYSYAHPQEAVAVNVLGTLNVLTGAREAGVRRVVHASSSEVYGTAQYVPMDEQHPLKAQSPYAATKIAADALAYSFHSAYNLPLVIVRPFNTYGPRQSARAVIPAIITQALAGNTVKLGALHPTRDFTYVTDTVDGFIKAAESQDAMGQVLNLGVGEAVSIGEVAQRIIALVGKPVELVADEARLRPAPSEVRQLISNNTRAKTLLGWSPQVPLTEGLQRTIQWIAAHLDLYHPDTYVV